MVHAVYPPFPIFGQIENLRRQSHLRRNPRRNPAPEIVRKDKEFLENLSEQEIDKTLADSFPASDPPSWH